MVNGKLEFCERFDNPPGVSDFRFNPGPSQKAEVVEISSFTVVVDSSETIEIKISDVVCSNHGFWRNQLEMEEYAISGGFPYYEWNGRIYETRDGQFTNVCYAQLLDYHSLSWSKKTLQKREVK